METVCQVAFNMMSSKEARRAEGILREYLLRVCDQVSFTPPGSSAFSLFPFMPKFRSNRLKKRLDSSDIASQAEHEWILNLTDRVKQSINSASIFALARGQIFSGFTDPKFLKQGKEVAYFLTSENMLYLYIPDSDKAALSAQGVYLDSPEM